MVSWKRLTRWCRRRLIHLHNQNKHPHPLIWARGFAPPPKKTSLLTKSSLSSWFVQHSQPRAFVLPLLSWKILLVYFFLFGHFGDSVLHARVQGLNGHLTIFRAAVLIIMHYTLVVIGESKGVTLASTIHKKVPVFFTQIIWCKSTPKLHWTICIDDRANTLLRRVEFGKPNSKFCSLQKLVCD